MTSKLSENNFDLIRLLAALQVAVLHVLYYLSPQWGNYAPFELLSLFPGVPIFFFVSGFLISRAYEKTSNLKDYARNRSLRIFPALHVCVLVNLLMVWATGYFTTVNADFTDVFILYIAKTTFLQFYNPDFMRHFGDGVLNGSLWTICVELQFYVVIPLFYRWLIHRFPSRANLILLAGILISLICNRVLYELRPGYGEMILWKLTRVSFIPWFYMFLTGVLVQRNFSVISKFLMPSLFVPAILVYTILAWLCLRHGFLFDNSISPLLFFPLVSVVLIGAFSAPTLARKLLHGQDFSYSLYLYHIPFMNMALYYGFQGELQYTAAVLLVTLLTAVISWFLVEKPSLRKKRKASHPLATPA